MDQLTLPTRSLLQITIGNPFTITMDDWRLVLVLYFVCITATNGSSDHNSVEVFHVSCHKS